MHYTIYIKCQECLLHPNTKSNGGRITPQLLEPCDISLVSEDAELVLAHKAVLSTCSIFFKALLGPNAVAYLGGVSTKHLQYVLEYIYLGEANIAHEDVAKFLEHAKKIKLQSFKGENEEVKIRKFSQNQNCWQKNGLFLKCSRGRQC